MCLSNEYSHIISVADFEPRVASQELVTLLVVVLAKTVVPDVVLS